MNVTLVSAGGGRPETMTAECARVLEQAQCVIGAERLLNALPDQCTARRVKATRPADVCQAVLDSREENCVVLYSGDTGFYSGANALVPLLRRQGIVPQILPGLSSVQILAARIGRPWQNWNLVSAHSAACDPVAAVCSGREDVYKRQAMSMVRCCTWTIWRGTHTGQRSTQC